MYISADPPRPQQGDVPPPLSLYSAPTEKIAHVIKSNFVFHSQDYNKHKTSSK